MKQISIILCIALLLPSIGFTMTQKDWDQVQKTKMRAKIVALGMDRLLEIQMKNGKKLKGFLIVVDQEQFTIRNASGDLIIPFDEVKKVKHQGAMSGSTKWCIGLASVLGAVFLFFKFVPLTS